jgi:hypothetical protein
VEKMLDTAVTGMDEALLKAVEANKMALSRLAEQGADLKDKHLKKALADLEKFEDTLFSAVKKAAGSAGEGLTGPWAQVMEKFQQGGSAAGAQASATVEQLTGQVQQALREGRATSLKAAQTLAESYTAMVSGVLIGMTEALSQGSAAAADEPAAKVRRKR